MTRSHFSLASIAIFLPLSTLAAACASGVADGNNDEGTRALQQAQGNPTVSPTATPTIAPTFPPPTSILARQSRDHYLKARLADLRQDANAPALAAALVVDGATSSAAVSGVRKYGVVGDAKTTDAFMLKSCTKPMTGYLAARFVEMQKPLTPGSTKKFAWSTTILDVYPELASTMNAAYTNTTVQALMTHSSGMPYMPLTEGADEFANITSSLTGRRYEYVKAAVKDAPVSPSPYGGGSIIVAAMLEKITGQSWESLMNTYVYDDIGMTNSGVGSNPYPVNTEQVASHTRNGAGTPVVRPAPSTYESEPHAPAGRNPHASILDFAKFAGANLTSASATLRPGSLGSTALATALTTVPGTGNTRSGWGVGSPSWATGTVYWHNGADGADYSLVHLVPNEDYATVVMTNMDDPNGALGSAATQELVAMRRHLATAGTYDDALNIGESASATSGAATAAKATDGSLLTRWTASTAVTTPTLTFSLGGLKNVSKIRIAEVGDKVQSFVLEAWRYSAFYGGWYWASILTGTTIGENFAASFEELGTSQLRLRVTASSGGASIAEIWAL